MMAKTITCDNCGSSERLVGGGRAPDEWLRVGWNIDGDRDACSIDCARAILDDLQQLEWEMAEATPAEGTA